MIWVFGDAICDVYLNGDSVRLSPEAPVPVILNPYTHVTMGGASLVVRNLEALGNDVNFISDPDNKIKKTRVMANDHVICRIDEETYKPFDVTPHLTFDKNVELVVISDYNKGVVHEPYEIIKYANSLGVKVFVDPKKPLSRYRNAFLVKCNLKEINEQSQRYTGANWTFGDHKVLQAMANTFEIEHIVVTAGDQGAFLCSRDGTYHHVPGIDNGSVIDVTGAGDVFLAALADCFVEGKPLKEALEFANEMAAISVTKKGPYVLNLIDIVSASRFKPKTIFTNGVFDVLHAGHIEYLKASKALGSKLIVGINSDDSVKRLKGPSRPINTAKDRKLVLESLSFVDEVHIFDEDTPYKLIEKIKPDIITKGGDYKADDVVGNSLAKVVIIPFVEGHSSTRIINA